MPRGLCPRVFFFLLSLDLLFSLHLGPELSDMPAHSRGAFPPCPGTEQVEFLKHCPGELLEDAEHPHAAQGHIYCLIYRKDSHKANQPQVRDAATSILLLRYPVVPQDKVSPDSKHGKTGTDHLLEPPHLQMLLGLATAISLIDLPSATCQEAAGQSSSN